MSVLSLFDPTSSRSPFGGVVRSAIGNVPGGSSVLGVVDSYNTTNRAAATNRAGSAAAPPVAAPAPWYTRPVVLVGALVAVVALVGLLIFRRR